MDDLENNLKKWINIDKLIQEKNKEIKELRQVKSQINTELIETITQNNLQKSTFVINNNNIRYTTSKQTSSLTLKYLEKCLNDKIMNKSQVEEIMNYIKDNREKKIINDLKNNVK